MSKTVKRSPKSSAAVPAKRKSRSVAIAAEGIATGNQYTGLMCALIEDMLDGSVPAVVGNACIRAGSSILKAVEMQQKYGKPTGHGGRKELTLGIV